MIEILQYTFIQNAIIAAILISIITAIIGSLIVVNRMVFLSGAIAHSSCGGIGIAVFFGLPLFWTALGYSVLVAICLSFLSLKYHNKLDNIIGIFWAVGMAIGIILIDLTPGYKSDFMSFLFGSILTISMQDILYMGIFLVFLLFFIFTYYREILIVSYDKEFAKLKGVNVVLFQNLILIFSSIAIVLSVKVVGIILVIALLTIPIYLAQDFSKSLFEMFYKSTFFSIIFAMLGLYISYCYDISSGASIILVSGIGLIIIKTIYGIITNKRSYKKE